MSGSNCLVGGGRAYGGGSGRGRASSSAPAGTAITGPGGLIPAGSKKIVQNIKEIVNYPEQEIYAMLKECNMDPAETVNRLLNQDTFQEVKSKRDRKKEVKEMSDVKTRGIGNSTNRGGRVVNDRASRAMSHYSSSNDYGVGRGKPLPKKENHPLYAGSSPSILGSAVSENFVSRTSYSVGSTFLDTSGHAVSATDAIYLPPKPSEGIQHAWSSRAGQVSMADVVRMGRTQTKFATKPAAAMETLPTVASNDFQATTNYTSSVLPSETSQEWYSSQDLISKDPEAIHGSITTTTDGHFSHDDPCLVEPLPAENRSLMFVSSSCSSILVEPSESSSFHDDVPNLHLASCVDDTLTANANLNSGSGITDSVRFHTSYDEQPEVDNSKSILAFDDSSLKKTSLYHSQRHKFELHEVEAADSELLSVDTDLQQLSIRHDQVGKTTDDHLAVIFAKHLQVTNADCSHLSFGSFRSGMGAGFSVPDVHTIPNGNQEPTSTTSESSFHHADVRSPKFYNDDQSNSNSVENVASGASIDVENYNQSSPSQIKGVDPNPTNEVQFQIPSLMPSHSFSSSAQANVSEQNYLETNSQVQNIASLSSMMQAYANSLQSNRLASSVQPVREFDTPYLPSHETQPMKYSSGMSSASDPVISLPEGSLSISQTLESSGIAAGPTVPQQLSIHQFSQPTLPLGPFTNMISYPFLPPSYGYMPSAAFPPAYTGSTYHQTPTGQSAATKYTLPQYKNNISLSSLPQSAAVPSGYGGFGSSSNIPGNFVFNPPSAPTNTTASFGNALGSQYRDTNPYASLQQNESSNTWLQGSGSRSVSTIPANTYYSLQGQSQHSGFRQAQPQPSPYGALGYTSFYHSQAGGSQEHQQNTNEAANLSNSQGIPSQSSHHLWPRNY